MNIFKHRPLALCCFVFLVVYLICFYIPPIVKLIVFLGALIIAVIFFRKRALISAVSVFVMAGCVFGYVYYDQHAIKASVTDDRTVTEFEIIDINFNNSKIAYVDGIEASGYKYHYTIYNPPEFEVGDIIKGDVVYKEIEPDDSFDVERYYNSKDIWIEADVTAPEKTGHNNNFIRDAVLAIHSYCTDTFEAYTDGDTVSVLSALSIGNREGLDESLKRDFNRAGLSHMLAISGMHLSVIMGCIAMFADIFNVNRRISSVIIASLCVCFIFIAGASSSVLRAGIMFIIMSFGSLFRRVSDSLTNLMLSVTLIVLFSPSAIFDTGLILSFTATFGIVIIVGYYMRKTKQKHKNLMGKFISCVLVSLLTTLAAQAFSFIPMLIFFDSISIVSLLSNLLVSPIITVLLFAVPLLLLVSKFSFIATGIGYVLDIITGLLIKTVGVLSSIPNALISLDHPFTVYTFIAIAFGVALIFVLRKRYAYIMPFLCWFVTFLTVFFCYNLALVNNCEAVFFSEASSDAVFIRDIKGSIYIDLGKGSGASEDRAFDMIKSVIYSNELDYWVITDYTNSIVRAGNDYMNEFYIRNICIPTPYDSISEAAAREFEYYAVNEGVNIRYYDYAKRFEINGIGVCVYEPVRFENSSVFIPSADIYYGERKISYIGCGYFDNCGYRDEYDILYIGDCGTKRKQTASPYVSADKVFIAENNEIAARNIKYSFNLSHDKNFVKFRISR